MCMERIKGNLKTFCDTIYLGTVTIRNWSNSSICITHLLNYSYAANKVYKGLLNIQLCLLLSFMSCLVEWNKFLIVEIKITLMEVYIKGCSHISYSKLFHRISDSFLNVKKRTTERYDCESDLKWNFVFHFLLNRLLNAF